MVAAEACLPVLRVLCLPPRIAALLLLMPLLPAPRRSPDCRVAATPITGRAWRAPAPPPTGARAAPRRATPRRSESSAAGRGRRLAARRPLPARKVAIENLLGLEREALPLTTSEVKKKLIFYMKFFLLLCVAMWFISVFLVKQVLRKTKCSFVPNNVMCNLLSLMPAPTLPVVSRHRAG